MFESRKKLFIILLSLVLVLALIGGCAPEEEVLDGPAEEPDEPAFDRTSFVFGSSVDGSYGYLVLEAMSSVLNNHFEEIRFSSLSTDGGAENIMLLNNEDIDAGHSNNNDILMAYEETGPFEGLGFKPQQLISYGGLTQIIAVREDSDMYTLEDLEGRSVIVGPPGSGLETTMSNYFDFADIEIDPVHLAIPETGDAFIGGRADAAVLLFRNGEPYPLNMEVEAALDIRYIPWDPEVNDMMNEAFASTPGVIHPDVSEYMDEPFDVYVNPMVLIVRPDLEEEVAYQVTKTLIENVDELMNITPHLETVHPDNVTDGIIEQFPVHPGAVRYYEEAGLWEDRLQEG